MPNQMIFEDLLCSAFMGNRRMNEDIVILSKCFQLLRVDYIHVDKFDVLLHFGGINEELKERRSRKISSRWGHLS